MGRDLSIIITHRSGPMAVPQVPKEGGQQLPGVTRAEELVEGGDIE